MSQAVRVAAVDLGATSGRVMAGVVETSGAGQLTLTEVHRFANGGIEVDGSVRWDIRRLYREALEGLRRAAADGPLDGIGIDSWAIDYGLLDEHGELIADPYSHRDPRVEGVMEKVAASVGEDVLYATTGLQQLKFNTLYQLVASLGTPELEAARTLLLIPDLLAYWLTGQAGAERTNASTTQLYDVRTHSWALDLAQDVGVPTSILPPLRSPGEVIGPVLDELLAELGLDETVPVIAVGSHDTASAVVGVPAVDERFAYISSGTWSLVGLELDKPVLTEAARQANFTNEGGVDGTVRFLKNVMGLWVLNECARVWNAEVPELVAAAAARAGGVLIDIDDESLLTPSRPSDPMPDRVERLVAAGGHAPLGDRGAIARCILDSLADAYARHLRTAGTLSGHPIEVVHVVGGGSENELLCQLTADACGLPVVAGPTEAAALGNVLVQARTLGADLPDLAAMRRLVRATHSRRQYDPRPREGEK